ncbi:hypothetical protein VVR12_08720 [Rothia sp. LK2588]|uniref:hypothetical protein n=1 Tax=Rothia sp. LK2588 TaxID=3114369 RepID=UPI0034CD4BF4
MSSREYCDLDHEVHIEDGEAGRSDGFFELVDEEDTQGERSRLAQRLKAVGLVLAAVLLTLALALFGVRQLNEAKQNEGLEGKTWVMQGKIVDLTPDLQTESNVAKYSGTLPNDQGLNGVTFKSELSDARQVNGGQSVEFRGSQTGTTKDDFPEEVDALLAKTGDHQIEVVRTDKVGSLKPVTESSVRGEQMAGWASLVCAVLIFAGGVAGALRMSRRARNEL